VERKNTAVVLYSMNPALYFRYFNNKRSFLLKSFIKLSRRKGFGRKKCQYNVNSKSMKIHFFKYQGAGNDFILIDNRTLWFDGADDSLIRFLCDRRFGVGADGLMLLEHDPAYDFRMRYFNSDGHEASMCGNGGRCMAAFARKLHIIQDQTRFMAVDGSHEATLGSDGQVTLRMRDVASIERVSDDYFLDTGSPHYVLFRDSLEGLNVYTEGRKIRYNERFRETGTNVNFVQWEDDRLKVVTYERGVEDETLACGTGITAAALCAALESGKHKGMFQVTARGGVLWVSFERKEEGFRNIWLKGPAEFVFEGWLDKK
jgi:diaminopimelate epimerase